jgi:hypothetical protein
MKAAKIIYWIFTSVIVILDGLLPVLTSAPNWPNKG